MCMLSPFFICLVGDWPLHVCGVTFQFIYDWEDKETTNQGAGLFYLLVEGRRALVVKGSCISSSCFSGRQVHVIHGLEANGL